MRTITKLLSLSIPIIFIATALFQIKPIMAAEAQCIIDGMAMYDEGTCKTIAGGIGISFSASGVIGLPSGFTTSTGTPLSLMKI